MKFVIITAPSSMMAFLSDRMSEASMRRSSGPVAVGMIVMDKGRDLN